MYFPLMMQEKEIAYIHTRIRRWSMNGASFTFHCEAKQGLDDIFLAAISTC